MTVRHPVALGVAMLAFAAMVAGYIFWPATAAAGWLTAFVFWSALPMGALALVMIHRLVGGGWGDAISPVTRPLVRMMPVLVLAVLPVLASATLLIPWHAASHAVQAWWLNPPAYDMRSILLLGVLSVFAVSLERRSRSPLLSATGLIVYAFAISILATDWILAFSPPTFFTAFGAAIAVQQLTMALAFSVLFAPPLSARRRDDMAGLLIAMIMGVLYLNFMDFLVAWYGNVPDRILWYGLRTAEPWRALLLAAFFLGAFIPFILLLSGRTRFVPNYLRLSCVSVLLGAVCYDGWLIAPQFGAGTLAFGAIAVVFMGALIAVYVVRAARQQTWEARSG